MTKSLSFIFLVVLLGACNLSEKQVILTQNLKSGKTYHYTVQKIREIDSVFKHSKTTTETEVSLSVAVARHGATECTWTYGSTIPIGVNPDSLDKTTKQYLNYNNGLTVKFLVDDRGRFESLTNLPECQAFLENAYAVIFGDRASKKKVDEVMEELIRPTYSTSTSFLTTFCHEITALFGVVGDTLVIGKPRKFEDDLFLSVADTGIKFLITEKLKETRRGKATISFEQRLSPGSSEAFLQGVRKKVVKLNPYDTDDEELDLDYLVTGSFIYNIKDQLITEFKSRKQTQIRVEKRIEGLNIVLNQ